MPSRKESRSFAEILEKAIAKYEDRTIEAVEVMDELITLAKATRETQKRGENLGLTDEEIAL